MNNNRKPGVNLKAMLLGVSTTNKQKRINLAISQVAIGWNNQNTVVFGDIANDATVNSNGSQEVGDDE